MENKITKEVVYKDQISHLLMMLLEHGKWEAKDDEDFEENFYEVVSKKLKFQHKTDWQKYQSSVHLLEDTEYAIASAFKYQLGDLSVDNKDYGGMLLRLYGVLNAVYLQIGAYENIMNLLNYPEKGKTMKKFKQLKIYKLRGIAGAHTVNYEYDDEVLQSRKGIHKTTAFSILQCYLEETGKRIHAIDKNGLSFEFNLLESLTEYEGITRDLLIKLIEFSIQKFYTKKEDKEEMKRRLNELLPDLIDYSTTNENERYWKKQDERIDEVIREMERSKKANCPKVAKFGRCKVSQLM